MTIAKFAAAALLGSALVTGAAYAQTATTPAPSPAPSAAAPSTSSQNFSDSWRASKIIGLSVYNESNEKLGSISELITDKSGKISAAIVGVGGFLGVGQHDIAVNFDQLKFMDEPVKASTASNTAPGGAGMSGSSGMSGSKSTVGSSGGGAAATPTKDHWAPDHAVMSGTKDQLKAMPAFKYSESNK